MSLEDMRYYICTVDFVNVLCENSTVHQIAKNVKRYSRRTVYRHIEHLCKLGLLCRVHDGNNRIEITPTKEGRNFVSAWKRMF